MIGTVRGTTRQTKNAAGLPAPIASFTTNIKGNIPELSVAINPVQSGSGDPSPSNERPITGHTGINITQQSTIHVTDNAPYLFRQSGGDNNADVYNQETDKLVGASVVVNQLVQNGNFADGTNNWSKNATASWSVSNNVLTLTTNSGTNNNRIEQALSTISNHKYLLACFVKTSTSTKGGISLGAVTQSNVDFVTSWTKFNLIVSASDNNLSFIIRCTQNVALDVDVKECNVIDLTQMFGSTKADEIYAMEQATAGSGIAYLRKYGFFTKDYYPYTANTLQSVNTSAHITMSANRWDEEWEVGIYNWNGTKGGSTTRIRCKNFIPCSPNTTYYIVAPKNIQLFYYDVSKDFIRYHPYSIRNTTFTTPANAYYITFFVYNDEYGTTYNHDISINYPSTIADYHAYSKHEYALPNIDLRGLYKLDASNNLYADGDTLESDGTVTRKYGIVDLGTQTWTKSTSGNFTFFYTPVSGIKRISTSSEAINLIVFGNYKSVAQSVWSSNIPCVCKLQGMNNNNVLISDHNFDDKTGEQVATALSGIYLVYELATPTTETAEPFTNPQLVDKFGTEEYTDERNFPLPVGHETIYLPTEQREYTVDFGQTVYGGSLNVTTGVLTVTHARIDMGTMNWYRQSTNLFYTQNNTIKGNSACICDIYAYQSVSLPPTRNDKTINTASYFGLHALSVYDTDYDDENTFKASLNGKYCVYELATPITVQLTPTQIKALNGANNVFADTGNVNTLKYTKRVDTSLVSRG